MGKQRKKTVQHLTVISSSVVDWGKNNTWVIRLQCKFKRTIGWVNYQENGADIFFPTKQLAESFLSKLDLTSCEIVR